MWHTIFASGIELMAAGLLTSAGHDHWMLAQFVGGMMALLPAVCCMARQFAVPEDQTFGVADEQHEPA